MWVILPNRFSYASPEGFFIGEKRVDRYKKAESARTIDGYFFPSPFQEATGRLDLSFEKAKEEAIQHYQEAIINMRSLTYEDFLALKRRSFNP